MFITSYTDITSFPCQVTFRCTNCNCITSKQFRKTTKPLLLCHSCNIKDGKSKRTPEQKEESENKRKITINKKYGSFDNYCEHVQSKIRETNLSLYGVKNVFQRNDIIKKSENTKLERYGDKHYTNPLKMRQTMVERYGAPTTLQSNELAKKTVETKRAIYGDKYELIVDKIKHSKLERYGNENYNNSIEHIKTCFNKYGVGSFSQTDAFRKSSRKKYNYNGLWFDSSWELALWIYALDHNEEIIKEPCSFKYVIDGVEHLYFPDFLYRGELIEIKGDQFFNGSKLCNPYDHDSDRIFEEKGNCATLNGVSFWRKKDVQFAIDYVNSKYGKKYLKSFKNN